MKFRDFIQPDAIVASLASPDRDGVIRELVAALASGGAVAADATDELVGALLARERSGTTGFGLGVAAPHCKHPRVGRVVGAVGLSRAGVDFAAKDGRPVHVVFVLLSPQGHDQEHLQAMDVVFRHLKEEAFRRNLRRSETREQVTARLEEADD